MKATESAIHMMKEKSIKAISKNIEVPNLNDQNLILTGYKGYDAMCVTCHAAPGKSATVIADGLHPKPPELDDKEIFEEWNDNELFWIIKNGIKLTGMPAYGPTHSDDELWAIVAFLNRLQEMSKNDYKAMGDDGAEKAMKAVRTDGSFFQVFGIELTGGKPFSKSYVAERPEVILNNKAAQLLSWETWDDKWFAPKHLDHRAEVTGFVRDFNFESLSNEVIPTAFLFDPDNAHIMYVRLGQGDFASY